MINDKILILVVDDEPKIRMLVKKWLLDEGYNVDTAIDGNDCINKLKPETDFIILDIMMPGPKPNELNRKISIISPNSKIIYLTAVEMFNPTQEQEKKGFIPVLSEQVKGYLVKPVDKTQLIKKLNEISELDILINKPKKKLAKNNK